MGGGTDIIRCRVYVTFTDGKQDPLDLAEAVIFMDVSMVACSWHCINVGESNEIVNTYFALGIVDVASP